MAKNDVRIFAPTSAETPTWRWQTEANTTVVNAGEPCKIKSAGSPYAIPVADAEPVVGTTTAVLGIAQSTGTQTASADGVIDIYMPKPGVIYAAKAKSTTAFDTQTEINALCGDRVLFDLTTGSYTVDESAGDNANNGLYIIGGDPLTSTVYFTLRIDATFLGR